MGLGDPKDIGVSQNLGVLFEGPNNKDYSLLGSILGSPYFGKLPYLGILRGLWGVPLKGSTK